MKSGLACGFAAFKALLEARELHPECGRIGFAGTVDEEGYSIGARALLTTEYARSSLLLLGEPYFGDTEANPVPCAMPGKVLYRITTRGKAAHGFHPEDGINAVEDAARIVAALDRLPLGKHPLIRSGNYSTLKFEGGYQEYAIVVPEVCEVIVTRLLVPGETRDLAVEQLRSLVESLGLRSRVTIETPPPSYQPLVIDQDLPALGHFRRAYREVLGREPVVGGRQGIVDGSIYMNEGGIPTIAFGPRGGGLHMAGEWVETATLEPVAMVMAETALREMAS